MMTIDEIFTECYKKGLRSTIRLLLAKGIEINDAEELAQSAWTRGWEARAQVREPDRLLGWVNTIAIHQMYRAKKNAKRWEELREYSTDDMRSVESKVDAERLLNHCSDLDKTLIREFYGAGRSMDEVASAHGLKSAGVRVRVHRAKLAMRRHAVGSLRMAA